MRHSEESLGLSSEGDISWDGIEFVACPAQPMIIRVDVPLRISRAANMRSTELAVLVIPGVFAYPEILGPWGQRPTERLPANDAALPEIVRGLRAEPTRLPSAGEDHGDVIRLPVSVDPWIRLTRSQPGRHLVIGTAKFDQLPWRGGNVGEVADDRGCTGSVQPTHLVPNPSKMREMSDEYDAVLTLLSGVDGELRESGEIHTLRCRVVETCSPVQSRAHQ